MDPVTPCYGLTNTRNQLTVKRTTENAGYEKKLS